MRGALTLLLVVVLLLAAGFLLLRGHEGPEAGPEEGWARDAGDASTPADLRTEAPAPGATRAAAGRDAGPEGRARAFEGIRGVVEDERGRPLPAATVRLETFEANVFRGAAATAGETLATARTDADGTFELALAEHRWVRVVAALAGYATMGARVAGPGTFVRLVLPPGLALEVDVVDAQDRPVPGARVEAFAGEAVRVRETDEQGRARLDDLPPGHVSLRVEAALGRRARTGPVPVRPDVPRRVTVLLREGVAVQGIVLDAETRLPLPGAEVHAAQSGLAFAAEPTGPDGAFGPLPAGGAGSRVMLAVRAPGYAPRMVQVVLPHDATVHRLPPVELRPAEDWRGRVVDARGRPVAGARVTYTAAGIAGRAPPETRTDEQGGFTLPPPSPPAPGRHVVLTAQAARGSAARALRTGDPAPADLVLTLTGGRTVTGRVVGPTGEALPGASVRLEPRWSEIADRREPGPETARLLALGETARLALSTATDAQGRWRLDAVPEGTYDLRLVHAGTTDFLDEPLEVGGADADAGVIRFGDGHVLRGTAYDEADRPLAGVGIVLRELDGHPRLRRTVTDAEGAWTLAGIPAGAWRLDAGGGDRTRLRLDLEVPAAEPVDLVLGRGTRLTGRVLDADGDPYPGVFRIWLEAPEGGDLGPGGTFRDPDGRFELYGMPAGSWTVRADTPRGDLGTTPAPVELRPRTTLDVTVALGPGAVLSGTLRRPDGRAIGGGRIALTHEARGTAQTVTTGSDGTFRATGLQPGHWRVVAHGRGGAAVVRTADVAAGERRDLELVLGPVSSVEVTVRGADGGARVGAYVLVRPVGAPASRPETVPRTGRDGRVVLEDVPQGTVRIEARTRGGESGRTEVVVSPESGRAVEIVVRKTTRPARD